ncbi:glycolipid sulfotransferase [soil metagenome]
MADRALVRYRGIVYDSERWLGFRFRPGDIVVSTPPKCGTTWTQMICALLILQRTDLGAPLSTLSPWFDMLSRARKDVLADLEAQRPRRFIKNHTTLDGLPLDDSVTYISVGRDPRDVFLSMDAHLANMDFERYKAARVEAARIDGVEVGPLPPPPPRPDSAHERFWLWAEAEVPPGEVNSSLLRTLRHLETFWDVRSEPNVVLLHFDDLKADLHGQMRMLATRLGIDVPEDLWPELVAAADFAAMRDKASAVAPTSGGRSFWRKDARFFRSGTSGQWRELLDDDDLDRYRARVSALVAPDLAAWAHGAAKV